MDYKVLARKWRPKVFADVAGQKPVVQALQYALQSGKLHHAYLFTGTRGVGKTTIARILAKALSCELGVLPEPCNNCSNCKTIDEGKYIDVIEIDAASRTKVEDTRELLDNVPYAPVNSRYKIYIIDEVHMLSNHSFNALLKTLEEPPAHVKFLFATTDPQKLPVTILSRCIQFHLGIFTLNELLEYLQGILKTERISFDIEALKKICRAANGSIRDALTLLEQVISLGQGDITAIVVEQILGFTKHDILIALLTTIIDNNPEQAFAIIEQLRKEAVDFNKILQELLVQLHTIAVLHVLPNYLEEQEIIDPSLLALAKRVDPVEIQLLYQIAVQGRRDLPYAPDLKLGFEMVVLRMIAFQPIDQISNIEQQKRLPQQIIEKIKPSKEVRVVEKRNLDINAIVNAQTPESDLVCKAEASLIQATDAKLKPKVAMQTHGQIAEANPNYHAEPILTPDWAELIYEMKLTGLTKAVAQHCTITSWKQDSVVLTLDPMHKALLQQHHEQRLQDALQHYLEHDIQVKINIGQIVDDSTPAAQHRREQEKNQQAAENLVKENKHVQELLETFNAKIERVIVKDEA